MYRLAFLLTLLAACDDPPMDAEVGAVAEEHKGDAAATATVDVLKQADRADAVFVGRVVEVRYRESEPDGAGISVPFTFFTFEVEQGLKGVQTGERVTLRFFGGPAKETLLLSSEYPNLDVGDREIVFVQDNGYSGVPLAGGNEGRIRLSGGSVYTAAGFGLNLNGNQVRVGEFTSLAENKSQQVGDFPLDFVSSDAPRTPGLKASEEKEFVDWLANAVSDDGSGMFQNTSADEAIYFDSTL